jgi:hypothetical protein
MVRRRVDDGFEVDAHPIAWRRARVMLARAEADEIWSRGGPGGNPGRRNPVVGIVEGSESYVLARRERLVRLPPDGTVDHLTFHFDDKTILASRSSEIMRLGRTTHRA